MDVRARENIGDENSLLNLDAKLAQQTLGIRLTHEGVKIVASKQVCSKDQLRKEKCSLPINVSKCKQNVHFANHHISLFRNERYRRFQLYLA